MSWTGGTWNAGPSGSDTPQAQTKGSSIEEHHWDPLTATPAGDFDRQALQSSLSSGVANLVGLGVTFASHVMLARLLTPADFGLVAMATSVGGLLVALGPLGLDVATLQRDRVDHAQVSTLFWFQLVAGILMGLGFAAAAPLLAWANGEDALLPIACVLALLFPLATVSLQHQALLRRQLRFGALAWIAVLAPAAALAGAVGAALAGWGHWALVVEALAGPAVIALGSLLACGWRPARTFNLRAARRLLQFGLALTASRAAEITTRTFDKIILGITWGAEQLGFYSKAFLLLMSPLQRLEVALGQVAIATLSRLRGDPQRYRICFQENLALWATLLVPGVIFCAVSADLLLPLALGPGWEPSIPLLRILTPVFLAVLVRSAASWLTVSLDRMQRRLRWSVIEGAVTILALALSARHGVTTLVSVYAVVTTVLRVPDLLICCQGTPVRVKDVAAAIARPFLAAGVAAGVTWLVLVSADPTRTGPPAFAGAGAATLRLVLAALTFMGVYSALWWLLPGGRATTRRLLGGISRGRGRDP